MQKIGEHVAVRAFPQKTADINLTVNLDGMEARLVAGRERARKRKEVVH